MAALEKERLVARRRAAKAMAGGIVDEIGLGLDDAADEPLALDLTHHQLAKQIARQGGGIGRQIGALQALRSHSISKRVRRASRIWARAASSAASGSWRSIAWMMRRCSRSERSGLAGTRKVLL